MNNVNVSIIKYLGKVGGGVLTLINIDFEDKLLTFDATFFYTEKEMILTIPEEIENKIGNVKNIPEYETILRLCLRKVVPFGEIIETIEPLNVKPYIDAVFKNTNVG